MTKTGDAYSVSTSDIINVPAAGPKEDGLDDIRRTAYGPDSDNARLQRCLQGQRLVYGPHFDSGDTVAATASAGLLWDLLTFAGASILGVSTEGLAATAVVGVAAAPWIVIPALAVAGYYYSRLTYDDAEDRKNCSRKYQ